MTLNKRALSLRSPIAALGIVLAVPFGLNASAGPALAAPTGRVIAQPCLNLRSSASSTASILGCIPYNVKITIACTQNGSSMTGPYGTTKLWDKTTWSGKTGYVTDAYVYTGSNSAVASTCSKPTPTPPATKPTLSKRVDSFISKWNGKRADYDGWFGSQCVDLFNFYDRDVVKTKVRPRVDYAKQLYKKTSGYTRVSASSAAKKGDVAIWGEKFSWTGHVAIVYENTSAKSKTLPVFSQNHQSPYDGGKKSISAKTSLSKTGLLGYLRPNS